MFAQICPWEHTSMLRSAANKLRSTSLTHSLISPDGTSSVSSSSDVQLPGCPQIVTRAEWGAREAAAHIGDMPDLPIYVFLHHGAGGECFDKDACMGKVRGYQNFHIDERRELL